MTTPDGLGLADVTDGCREGYLYAVEVARAQHDPAVEWEAFRETLWSYLTRVFGLEVDDAWPAELADPARAPSRDARQVAAQLHTEAEKSQRSAASPGS